jgi:AcrR family transcriptional regulator
MGAQLENPHVSDRTSAPTRPATRAPKQSQIDRTRALALKTAADLLREVGYRQLSIELVVQRSGIARSTLYRHWKNKAELAIAAFDAALGPSPPAPDLGDIRADLIFVYRRFPEILARSIWGAVLPSIIEASKSDPLFDGLLGEVVNQRKQDVREIFRRAIARGEIRPDANVEWAVDTLDGVYYHRLLIAGGRLDDKAMADWLVDSVLSQLLVAKP